MESKEKKTEIEKLSEILSRIQNLYYKKEEQLEELELEISELKQVLNYLNSLLSHKSFHSADEIYQKSLEIPVEKYFEEKVSEERVKGTTIKRKIFSKDEKEKDLLCILKFIDFNKVEIKFLDPEVRSIKETSENFINVLLKGAFIKIKEINPAMDLKYRYFKNSNIIEFITVSNLQSINDYDMITSKIRELLASDELYQT